LIASLEDVMRSRISDCAVHCTLFYSSSCSDGHLLHGGACTLL